MCSEESNFPCGLENSPVTAIATLSTQTENNHRVRGPSTYWTRGKRPGLCRFLNVNGSFTSLSEGFKDRWISKNLGMSWGRTWFSNAGELKPVSQSTPRRSWHGHGDQVRVRPQSNKEETGCVGLFVFKIFKTFSATTVPWVTAQSLQCYHLLDTFYTQMTAKEGRVKASLRRRKKAESILKGISDRLTSSFLSSTFVYSLIKH